MSLTSCLCCSVPDHMKMQNLNPKETSTGLTQKTLIPQVRYHPTIQTQTLGAQARTTKTRTSHSQKSIYGAECPLQTGSQGGDNTAQVNPVPVKPGSDEGQKQKPSSQKPSNKPKQKLDQRGATDPDPPQKLVQKGPPRPEHIPLGLGVQLDRGVVEEVEVLTRGQRINQDWFSWRKNRITASVAHRIAHCRFVNGKSRTPPPSYLAAITGTPHSNHMTLPPLYLGIDRDSSHLSLSLMLLSLCPRLVPFSFFSLVLKFQKLVLY